MHVVMRSPTDAMLVREAQAGGTQALGLLLERHRTALHAHALALLRHGPDAQDAVQDALIIAVRGIGEVREPEAVAGWLHTVLRHACFAQLRRTRDHRREVLDEARDTVAADLDPAAALDRLVFRDWVWHALEELSEPLRVVALLRFFGAERSYEEIAQICGVPVGTIRSRLSEVRAKMAAALADGADHSHADSGIPVAQWSSHFGSAVVTGAPDAYLARIAPDVRLDLRDIGTLHGRPTVADIVEGDLTAGVGHEVAAVTASSRIAILELRFVNPPDDPDHCPPGITQVHFHRDGVTPRMMWHLAARTA